MNSINIKNVCRTCLNENETLNKIKDAVVCIENNSKSVLELLNTFTLVEIKEQLPDLICLTCVSKLADLYKFKLQCDSSDLLLREYLKNESYFEERNVEKHEIKQNVSDTKKNKVIADDKSPTNKIKVKLKKKGNRSKIIIDSENADEHSDRFFCKTCSKSFKSKNVLTLHEKRHQTKEHFVCLVCLEEFNSKGCLNKHTKEIHKESKTNFENVCNLEEINTNICQACNKSFKSKYILTVHQKRHLHKGQFLCTTCGKGFNSKGCLNRHMRVHTGEKKYECNVCRKKFPSSNNLNLHSRIHSGVKPYLCTICGKSFTHPTGLTYHIRTHTKEKKYGCDICGKAFAIQCHLDNHRKIHTGERPFPCSKCEKAFIKKVDLQRHEAVHAGIKPHVCDVCEKEFLRPLHLNYHMMIHTAERPHKCSVCNKGFIRRYYLKDHMMKHHGIAYIPEISENKNLVFAS